MSPTEHPPTEGGGWTPDAVLREAVADIRRDAAEWRDRAANLVPTPDAPDHLNPVKGYLDDAVQFEAAADRLEAWLDAEGHHPTEVET